MAHEVYTDRPPFLPALKELKADGKQSEFNEKLVHALPAVKKYIIRSLNSAVEHEFISQGTFTPDAIIDDVYILAYEHVDELQDSELFEAWLFLKAEEVIQDRIDEKEYDGLYLTDLEKYSKAEWDAMEEGYSVDGGGDFVMMEEFEDPSYSEPLYLLEDVFSVDTEAELIEHIDKVLSREDASRHIAMVLQKLPLTVRTTYDLIVKFKRKGAEIAKLRKVSIKEITNQMEMVQQLVRKSMGMRFLGWS